MPHGSIPAQAGEPDRRLTERLVNLVYPRAGGGTWYTGTTVPASTGLSPPTMAQTRCGRVYPRAGGGTCLYLWQFLRN